ncbi:MAG: hypothetical protein AAGG01_11325, partial [Planctomycetota bacterium]
MYIAPLQSRQLTVLLGLAAAVICDSALAFHGDAGDSALRLHHAPSEARPEIGGLQTLSRPAHSGVGITAPSGETRDEQATSVAASRLSRAHGLYRCADEDTLWVRGSTYKASANEEGFTYIPFFGSTASQNWPIRFSLTAVRAAEDALVLAPANASYEGDVAVLSRGPVQARYRLSTDAVEQTFVVSSGDVTGDVSFAIDVETEMAVERAGQGLRFTSADGAVEFGSATVLDAAGARLDLPMSWDGGQIRYTIPASFVANATGEITLDPVITTVDIDGFTANLTQPDVAYDADTDRFFVLYQEDFSATDSDLYYSVLDGTSLSVASSGYLELGATYAYGPAVATIAATNRFVAVYTETDAFDRPTIMVRSAVSEATLSFTTASVAASFDEFFTREFPDVGGESYEGGFETNAVIVFE